MAKNIPQENIAHARAFIEKFGFGDNHLPVDQFDVFIIDRGLAQDPGTSDVKAIAYKGFIQQRGAARRLLNTAGTWINGSSFQVVVAGRGENYSIKPWAVNASEYARQITDQVEIYTKSRISNLRSEHNKAALLIREEGASDELHDSQQLLAAMVGHGISMQAKIAGLLKQYDTAYIAVLKTIAENRSTGSPE